MRISEVEDSGRGFYLPISDRPFTIDHSYTKSGEEFDSREEALRFFQTNPKWKTQHVIDVKKIPTPPPSTNPKNSLSDKKYYDEVLEYWASGVYGDYEKAKQILDNYIWSVDSIYEHGGELHRVIFIDDIAEFNSTDLGKHWTVDPEVIKTYPHTTAASVGGSGKKKHDVLITAQVEPHNIENLNVNVLGDWDEFEVNIIDPRRAKYKAQVLGSDRIFWQSHP